MISASQEGSGSAVMWNSGFTLPGTPKEDVVSSVQSVHQTDMAALRQQLPN